MIDDYSISCSKCDFGVQHFAAEYPYILAQGGARKYRGAPLIDLHAKEASSKEWTAHAARNKTRTAGHYVCTSCLAESVLDPETEPFLCRKCKSKKLVAAHALVDKTCPKCNKGKVRLDFFALT